MGWIEINLAKIYTYSMAINPEAKKGSGLVFRKVKREIERKHVHPTNTHEHRFFFSWEEILQIRNFVHMLPKDKKPVDGSGT